MEWVPRMPPSSVLHSEAAPTVWTALGERWSVRAVAVPLVKRRFVVSCWKFSISTNSFFHASCPCSLIKNRVRCLSACHRVLGCLLATALQHGSGLCLLLHPTFAAQQASSACNRSKPINLKTTELCFRIMLAPEGRINFASCRFMYFMYKYVNSLNWNKLLTLSCRLLLNPSTTNFVGGVLH